MSSPVAANKDGKEKEDNVVYMSEPNHSLKKMIGEDVELTSIFTTEKIKRCQTIIDEAKAGFFDTVRGDMARLETAMARAQELESRPQEFYNIILVPTQNIKGQALAFGFPLITRICGYIVGYCSSSKQTTHIAQQLIRKLLEALHFAVQNKITDDGGAVGRELLKSLEALPLK